MGLFDLFKKKDEDLGDLGGDLGANNFGAPAPNMNAPMNPPSNMPPGAPMSQPGRQPLFGMQEAPPPPSVAPPIPSQVPPMSPTSINFGQPQQQPQQSGNNQILNSRIDVLSSKIDTLKSSIDRINEKLDYIERYRFSFKEKDVMRNDPQKSMRRFSKDWLSK